MWSALALLLGLTAASAGEPAPITVGAPALAFSLPAINEQQAEELVHQANVTLGELVGIQPAHPVQGLVVYFFDRTGGGEGLRPLNTLSRRYHNQNVRIIGISVDAEPEVADWVNGLKLDFPVLRDNHRIVADRYVVRETPMVVVIDKEGLVFSVGAPPMMELEATVESEIKGLLGMHGD